jgi:hypothetical protein
MRICGLKNAFRDPLLTRPGCKHMPGTCRCEMPHYLRQSTPIELYHEAKYARVGNLNEYPVPSSEPPTVPTAEPRK